MTERQEHKPETAPVLKEEKKIIIVQTSMNLRPCFSHNQKD